MKFEDVRKTIEGIPYILPEMAGDLYRFILRQMPDSCLELGFGHGASSCYIAAALEELGAGRLTSVDLLSRQAVRPSIEELLARTGLNAFVEVAREATGYNWFLKKRIAERSRQNACEPLYDFCFIDGAKNWTIDTAAFFLVDKLLKPGGWIVFDDLQWTYLRKRREGKTKSDGVPLGGMDADELSEPHVELIFKLLVMQHPAYANFRVKDDCWAWAQKSSGSSEVVFEYSPGYIRKREAWEAETGRRHRAPFQPFAT